MSFFTRYRYVALAVVLTMFALSGYVYYILFSANVTRKEFDLRIPAGFSYADVKKILADSNVLINPYTFEQVASLMNYNQGEVPGGRYLLKQGMSNRVLVSKLRAASQDAIDLTFNNVRNVEELAGVFDKSLEADSLSILDAMLQDSTLQKYSLAKETAMTIFIPNTYHVFWNIKPYKLVRRMAQEADKFWNTERLAKAKKWQLTKEQVYTLASIVEKESNNKSERPTVAGVYLNRLRIGEKLRADPTVVFAVGDFTLRRVLFEHLFFDSPYNTYMYEGLPPGPIFMPSTNSIDAVLNAEQHEYIFFCAKPGYNSEHAFAKTAEQHQRNASIYHDWLEKEGIR
ncbi:MAG: endolytic transglycosylase MltG [Saprospiraceae bacterium]|nr:endolytic transglycosylase MltG [Saprospiraceae bacterium]